MFRITRVSALDSMARDLAGHARFSVKEYGSAESLARDILTDAELPQLTDDEAEYLRYSLTRYLEEA